MQTEATGSHSSVTDGNSLSSALFSLVYSDSVDRHIQNHLTVGFPSPSTLGEAMISSTHGQMSNPVADEFWNIQPGRNTIRDFSAGTPHQISSIPNMEGISHPVPRYAPFENHEKLATPALLSYPFDNTNYSLEGIPFLGGIVGTTRVQSVQPTQNSGLNEWRMLTEQEDMNSNNNPGPSRFSKELSLSLGTSRPPIGHGTSIQDQCSEMSSSGVTGYSLHNRSENTSCSSNGLSLSFNSCKPVHLSPLVSGSRFLHAMQEILAEIACFALENFDQMSYSATRTDNNASFSSSCAAGRGCLTTGFSDGLDSDHRFMFQNILLPERDVESKKKHLLSLLQLVDDQYNRCLDEIHTVISAFHAVTELDPNLHARFALPAISLVYRNLRERISSHILAMGPDLREGDAREDNSFETSFIQKQWALQQLKRRDHQLWRPQRGLPERSVSVLRAWMFQNFLHPYPKDAEKHLLALKSGLTRSQVSNWFINARVRLWKPMIEEMYVEMNKRKARRNEEETNVTLGNHMRFENRRFTMD